MSMDVNHRDENNRTPIFHAAMKGDHAMCLELLGRGADVNSRDNDGSSPLIMASRHGHTVVVSILIAAEAQLNVRDELYCDMTSLMWASLEGHTDIVRQVFIKDLLKTQLEPTFRLLLLAGADVNIQNISWNLLRTALIEAALKGHTDIVNLLLDAGAEVDTRDNEGRTAVIMAALKGNTDVVRILRDTGADLTIVDVDGKTALMWAVSNGFNAIIKLLEIPGA